MKPASSHPQRSIVLGLLRALRPALVPGAPADVHRAARDIAQVLMLPGLDAALAESLRHTGPEPPMEAAHVIARIGRIADAAEQEGSLAPFEAADAQLAALAETLAGLEWSQADDASRAVAAVSAADVLGDCAPGARRSLERVRLTPIAAGAVRAALDWLLEPGAALELQVQDTAITLTLPEVRPEGLALAGATLESAEGALLQGDDARWRLRLPLLVERRSYLLVRQGHLALALPWHSVARLRMLSPEVRAALAEPVLAPLAPAAEMHGERPAALLVRGLRRAWFVAERIVWRIVAEPGEPDRASPMPGLERSIELEDGDRYWVLDPAWVLRRVPAAETPAPVWQSRPHQLAELGSGDASPPRPSFEPLAPEALAAPVPATPVAPPVLTAEFAVPIAVPDLPPAAEAPPAPLEPPPLERRARERAVDAAAAEPALDSPPPAARRAPAPPPPTAIGGVTGPIATAPADAAPRALVVDDSLVARLFLARLLERRGYQVELAASAAEAESLLPLGPWAAVFADVALPDLAPAEWLAWITTSHFEAGGSFALVALTRDRDDQRRALGAGITLHLRKPFASEALDEVLLRMPRSEENPT